MRPCPPQPVPVLAENDARISHPPAAGADSGIPISPPGLCGHALGGWSAGVRQTLGRPLQGKPDGGPTALRNLACGCNSDLPAGPDDSDRTSCPRLDGCAPARPMPTARSSGVLDFHLGFPAGPTASASPAPRSVAERRQVEARVGRP